MVDTHRKETSHMSLENCQAKGSIQFFLEPTKDVPNPPPVTADNNIQLFICGQEGFGSIAADIAKAKHGIDMTCWGFDPGMMLVRNGGKWDEKQTFGYLLEQAAAKPGMIVRVLVWYSTLGSAKQSNMPGYGPGPLSMTTSSMDSLAAGGDMPAPFISHDDDGARHWDYNVAWYSRHTSAGKHGITVRTRDGDSTAIQTSLATERDKPSPVKDNLMMSEKGLLENHGTHHQKSIIIDFTPPSGGIAYVMGLNSQTEYWDTRKHEINDDKREAQGGPDAMAKGFTRMKPYQDYASRIEGGAVQYVYGNFGRAWERAGGKDTPTTDARLAPVGQVTTSADVAKANAALLNRCAAGRVVRLQVLRTQPEEREKTIKDFYVHSTTVAQNYLYLENQYFFYQEWADDLLKTRKEQTSDWKTLLAATKHASVKDRVKPKDKPMLHLFVVIPEPEADEMIPRTYDTLKTLGQENTMYDKAYDKNGKQIDLGQDGLMRLRQQQQAAYAVNKSAYDKTLKAIQDRYRNGTAHDREGMGMGPPPVNPTPEDRAAYHALSIEKKSESNLAFTYGLRVSVAMLYTSGITKKGMQYRDIYIHSKLMIVDDGAFTLGSANLNQRSMSVDSEINVACDCPLTTPEFREKVFGQHTNGTITGGSGQDAAGKAFNDWIKLMNANLVVRQKGKANLNGFLLPFKELRQCEDRYA